MLYGLLSPCLHPREGPGRWYLSRGFCVSYLIKRLEMDVEAVDLEPERVPEKIRDFADNARAGLEFSAITLEDSGYNVMVTLAVLERLGLNTLAVLRRLERALETGSAPYRPIPNLGTGFVG